jgi:hypothetical protein
MTLLLRAVDRKDWSKPVLRLVKPPLVIREAGDRLWPFTTGQAFTLIVIGSVLVVGALLIWAGVTS